MILLPSLLLSFAAAPAPALAAPPRPVPAPLVQTEELNRAEFMKRFRAALDVHADRDIENLIKRNPGTATVLVVEICEAISRGTDERLETEIQGFIDGWKSAFQSRFATEMYEYFSLMRLQVRAFRDQRKQDFQKFQRELDNAVATKNTDQLDLACESFAALAVAFGEAGDSYFVSECWWRVGQAWDDGVRGNEADYEKAGAAYKKCLEARDRIDLKDRFYSAAKLRSDQLLGQKKREEEKAVEDAGEGFTRRKPGASLSEEVGYDLSFEIVEDIESVLRPGYNLHELPVVWNSLTFGRPGSSSDFHTFPDGPQAIRTGAAVEIDVDRDGEGDVVVPLTGNIEPAEVTLGEGDSLRKWGFLAIVLTDQEIYQGIGIPLQPQESYLGLYIAPGGSMVGTVADVPIRVFDENMDGAYGSQPLFWTYVGLTKGSVQASFDTVQIDNAKRAVPWSEYAKIGSEWYQLLSDQNGTRVVASQAKVQTGTLKVKSKGITPLYFVVRGSGTFEHSFYDVMAGGSRGVEVPAGSYQLVSGEVRKGKRKQVMKAMIGPGPGTKTWTVNPGETTVIEIGAPFDMAFESKDTGSRVTVLGSSLALVGRAGERYERLWNCAPQPEVFVRKIGTKKGGRGTAMQKVKDYETVTNEEFQVAWFPRDTEVKKRTEGEEVELQLVEKKNKLFGKIESSWQPAGK